MTQNVAVSVGLELLTSQFTPTFCPAGRRINRQCTLILIGGVLHYVKRVNLSILFGP